MNQQKINELMKTLKPTQFLKTDANGLTSICEYSGAARFLAENPLSRICTLQVVQAYPLDPGFFDDGQFMSGLFQAQSRQDWAVTALCELEDTLKFLLGVEELPEGVRHGIAHACHAIEQTDEKTGEG